MAVLTREQVVGLAAQVGLNLGQIIVAGAICDAESGRRTDAVGVNPGGSHQRSSRDRGLWQINDVAHPDVSDACAFDPLCNARAMFRISSSGTNWTPWTTYNTGAYRQFLAAYQGIAGAGTRAVPAPTPDAIGTLQIFIRQGRPFWNSVLTAFELQVSLARAAVWGEQNAHSDLGSRFF